LPSLLTTENDESTWQVGSPWEEGEEEMHVFDQIRLQDLDRRDWQLWVLALAMILILAGGMALLMYSLVPPDALSLSERTMLRGVFGFCILAVLFVGYLVDRQMVISRLRKELDAERTRNLALRNQGSSELLQTLFGASQFCDRLALELQRATHRGQPLSALSVSLEAPNLSQSQDVYAAFGEAVKAMLCKLRAEDSIYQFTPGVFGVLLPRTVAADAHRVAVRVADGLSDAMGSSQRYSFDIRVTSYPEHAKTAREMEELMNLPHAA